MRVRNEYDKGAPANADASNLYPYVAAEKYGQYYEYKKLFW